ncbi:MAG: hypothetical protein AB7L09_00140 [Nitrospira sp.]
MGIEKSEFRMAVAHELGLGFDDALEAAQVDTNKWAGAKTAFAEASTAVEKLLAHIAQDVKEEKLTIEESNAAQNYVRRAIALCENLRLRSEVHEQRAHGRVEALSTVVKITKTFHDKEAAKAQALKAHEELQTIAALEGVDLEVAGPQRRPPSRPSGARPPNVIGALKNSEDSG